MMIDTPMEFFDILHDDGIPAGYRKSRSEAHAQGLWHRTVHVWARNNEGMLLLQKRAADKETFPGYWDISSAGHVNAGESSIDAAVRELEEEIGVIVRKDELRFLFTLRQQFHSEDGRVIDNEITDVYLVEKPVTREMITLNNSEVTDVRFINPDELLRYKENHITPHNDEYPRLISILNTNQI